MKINWKLLIVCVVIPLAAGFLSSLITRGGMEVFASIRKPPLSPPAWLFPVVWTILYTLMGISSYLVLTSGGSREDVQNALSVYAYQLLVNILWPVFFFNFQWFFFSLIWLVLLVLLVAAMIREFYQLSKSAAYLNIPYLVWLLFAGYLNFTIWWIS